jgi:hypothetical protein
MRRKLALVCVLAFGLSTGVAWAHGGGPGLSYDPCAKPVGQYYVHMSAYQPDANPFAEYCGSVPGGGKTLLVFDLIGAAMHQIPVGVEIRDADENTGSHNMLRLPAAEHPSGVIDVDLTLRRGHTYIATVTVGESPASSTIVFPIQVSSWWNGLEIPALLAIVVIALAVYFSLRLRRQQLAMLRKVEMRAKIRAVSGA